VGVQLSVLLLVHGECRRAQRVGRPWHLFCARMAQWNKHALLNI